VSNEPKDLIPSDEKQCLCPISVAILAIDEDTAEELAPLHAIGIEDISLLASADQELCHPQCLIVVESFIRGQRKEATMILGTRIDFPPEDRAREKSYRSPLGYINRLSIGYDLLVSWP